MFSQAMRGNKYGITRDGFLKYERQWRNFPEWRLAAINRQTSDWITIQMDARHPDCLSQTIANDSQCVGNRIVLGSKVVVIQPRKRGAVHGFEDVRT
jgi:hypothetical protein